MVKEAPKTIASFARNRLRARLLSVGFTHDPKPIKVRVVTIVNEAPKTIASFARNRLRARLLSVGLRDRETQNIGMWSYVGADHVARWEEAGRWHSDQCVFAMKNGEPTAATHVWETDSRGPRF